jgi:integrase
VKHVRRPRIDNRRERRLKAGEWDKLCEAARKSRQVLLEPLLLLALGTGMRRGELLSMRWCDFDDKRCTVTLSRTKNGHARTVPLTPQAVGTLQQLRSSIVPAAKPRAEDLIIPMSGNAVRLAFERLRRRAGVQNITFHDLRHEAVSRFVERGLSLAQVQMISGHRDLRMLMRYTHLAVDDIVKTLRDVA